MRILIMGLPGAGKTTLAEKLFNYLSDEEGSCSWVNADWVRAKYDDWDFSHEGRIRQAHRMRKLADECANLYFIADFVAPLKEMRDIFDADYTIWVNTLPKSRFEDTNEMFIKPTDVNVEVMTKDAQRWVEIIKNQIVINK